MRARTHAAPANPGPGPRASGAGLAPDLEDAGFAVVEWVFVLAISMVLFVAFVNFAVFQYGQGVVRSALDAGVRAGSVGNVSLPDAATVCAAKIDGALDDLLGGPLGDDVVHACGVREGAVVARARGSFEGWLWLVPDWQVDLEAAAVKERRP